MPITLPPKVGDKVKITKVVTTTRKGEPQGFGYHTVTEEVTTTTTLSWTGTVERLGVMSYADKPCLWLKEGGLFGLDQYTFEVTEAAPEWLPNDVVLFTDITNRPYPLVRNNEGSWDSVNCKSDMQSDAQMAAYIAAGRITVIVQNGKRVVW